MDGKKYNEMQQLKKHIGMGPEKINESIDTSTMLGSIFSRPSIIDDRKIIMDGPNDPGQVWKKRYLEQNPWEGDPIGAHRKDDELNKLLETRKSIEGHINSLQNGHPGFGDSLNDRDTDKALDYEMKMDDYETRLNDTERDINRITKPQETEEELLNRIFKK